MKRNAKRFDIRPTCITCGRRWQPAEGVDATRTSCSVCASERRAAAQRALAETGAPVRVGAYYVPLRSNPSS